MLALVSFIAAVLCPTNPPSAELPFLGCLALYASSGLLALSNNSLNLQSGLHSALLSDSPHAGERSVIPVTQAV